MKTSKIKTVRNIGRIRTLLVTLSVAVCLATLMGCGNASLEANLKAAEQGDSEAQTDLGMRYHTGDGVPKDYAEAVKWYRKAAEQGHAIAQYNLGFMYHAGEGVPQDVAEAEKWYLKAAEQGNVDAQFNLGVMYAIGEGVPQDDAEAFKWYRKAAEQELAKAQFNLGWMYNNGRGVPQDYVAAYAWYIVAAASGDDGGRNNRDIIKRRLTPSQLEKGKVLAREIYERITKRNAAETHYE